MVCNFRYATCSDFTSVVGYLKPTSMCHPRTEPRHDIGLSSNTGKETGGRQTEMKGWHTALQACGNNSFGNPSVRARPFRACDRSAPRKHLQSSTTRVSTRLTAVCSHNLAETNTDFSGDKNCLASRWTPQPRVREGRKVGEIEYCVVEVSRKISTTWRIFNTH